MRIWSQAGKLTFQINFGWHKVIFPWAFFLFQFCNSCLFSVKFSPSVSDSFTLNSSVDGSVTDTDSDVPVVTCHGIGVCQESLGKVACEKHVEKQVKCFCSSHPNMHTPLFCLPSALGSSDDPHNYFVTRLVPKSPSLLAPFRLSINILTFLSF